MRIYIAAASADLLRAIAVRDALIALGHTITEDWMSKVSAQIALVRMPNDITPEVRRECADADYAGVSSAHQVVILVPRRPVVTQGAWWEGGLADALEIPIIASGAPEDRARNIFLSRTVEVDTDAEAIALCKDDVHALYQQQKAEFERTKRKLAELEAAIGALASRLGGSASDALFAGIEARIAEGS
jgi:hypothetical protein